MTLHAFEVLDWAMSRAAFDSFVEKHTPVGTEAVVRIRRGGMDQVSFETRVDATGIRLVRDRGQVFVEASDDGTWKSARLLLGLADGVDPVFLASSAEPAPSLSLARWEELVAASRDAQLPHYEKQVGDAAVSRLLAASNASHHGGQLETVLQVLPEPDSGVFVVESLIEQA